MREIDVAVVRDSVAALLIRASCVIPDDLLELYDKALQNEVSAPGKMALEQIIKNAAIAKKEYIPCCQDTGVAVIFIDIGQEVHLVGGDLEEAVNAGVKKGYGEGYLRKSTIRDPLFDRSNPGDNTPGVIHMRILPGDAMRLRVAAKGFGGENKSRLTVFTPADGLDAVKKFVVATVRDAGADPCPPVVVGVGVGGTFEKCALLAKIASLRDVGQRHPHPKYAALEEELCELINAVGTGPQGFGGKCACLKVNIEAYATHIASLPVGVNISCHSTRHAETVI